jgi:hypothetical protein
MSNASLVNTAVNRLISQSNAVGRLAQDNGGFAAVVAAFESRDANAFRWVLERLEMLPYCEIVCEWVRVKLCSLRTAELCSPLIRREAEVPNLREFARAIAKLTSNEKVLRRVADAVACGDAAHYQAALNELQLGEFCSLISYWVCSVSYLEFCHSICDLTPVTVHDPLLALRLAGEFVTKAAKNEKALDAMGKAVGASDFDNLPSTVATLGFGNDDDCRYFCLFICVWWRVWTCHEFCEVPPRIFTGPDAIDEAQSFALAAHQLAGQPRAMTDLVDSALSRNTGTYREIVRRFRLEPYCWQLCGWVSSSICYGFCIRICPPPGDVTPLFTKVGCYLVGPPVSDFNANGTTTVGALAFTGTIPLIGLIPDGTAPDALQYRFTYQQVSPTPGVVTAITGAMVPPTIIGTLEYQYWDGLGWALGSTPFYANNPGATVTIPQEFGPALTVPVDTDTDANGWIQIPRLNSNAATATGLFTPGGAQGLILLDTTKLTLETFDLTTPTVLTAGETVPPADLSQKPVFQINFEAQTVSTSAPVSSNSLDAIALCNVTYKYLLHPDWPGPTPPVTSPMFLSVDIAELESGGGCSELDDVIHVLYTAYHPYIGTCSVFLQGPGVSGMTAPPGGSISLPIQPNQGQVLGTGNGISVTFTGTLTTPVLPGSVRIIAGSLVGQDNGSGGISGAGISAGTINYATGAVSITYAAAPAVGVQILSGYNTNLASGTTGTPFDMTGLPPCAYIIWLQATLNLTSGLATCGGYYGTFSDYIAFCTN